MARRDDVQAAYFQLLRAREELEQLRRYAEYVERERQRLAEFAAQTRTAAEPVPIRLRRMLRPSDDALAKALGDRAAVLEDEGRRLPPRIAAAESFVAEAESEHDRLRSA